MGYLKRSTTVLNPNLLIALGLSLILSVALTLNLHKFMPKSAPIYLTVHKSQVEYPTILTIKGVIENLNIKKGDYTQGNWDLTETQAIYLNSSGIIGQKGNLVIYGHDTKKVLGDLEKVKIGEEIILKTNSDESYKYKITQIKNVSSNDFSILEQGREEQITLYTCSGFLDSERLVVVGKRI